jgi:hypothetical protein
VNAPLQLLLRIAVGAAEAAPERLLALTLAHDDLRPFRVIPTNQQGLVRMV